MSDRVTSDARRYQYSRLHGHPDHRRDLYRQKLMQEKIVTEILELHIKAPFSDHFIVEANETWILDDCEKSDGSV